MGALALNSGSGTLADDWTRLTTDSEPVNTFVFQSQEESMLQRMRWIIRLAVLACQIEPGRADVLADWNEKTVAFVTPRMAPAAGQRVVAMIQVAMFDAINSIEPRYRPYLVQLPATATTSRQAAAAAAAASRGDRQQPDLSRL
jgi:hypothetical protein